MTDMPTIGAYRGVHLHAYQTQQRIDDVVKPAIDAVFGIEDPDALWAYLGSIKNPPEARILAGVRLKAVSEMRADKRLPRPEYTAQMIDASTAGLASHWADPSRYCTLFDTREGGAPRPPELGKQLKEYFSKAMHDEAIARGWNPSSPVPMRPEEPDEAAA